MKFISNKAFTETIHKILEKREKAFKAYLEANYVHTDYVPSKEIETRVDEIEGLLEGAEFEYHNESFPLVDNLTDEYGDAYDLSTFVSQDDLEEAFQNSNLEGRIEDLENLSFSQDQNDENSQRIKTLESENAVLKDRVLHIENFILKMFNKERFIE